MNYEVRLKLRTTVLDALILLLRRSMVLYFYPVEFPVEFWNLEVLSIGSLFFFFVLQRLFFVLHRIFFVLHNDEVMVRVYLHDGFYILSLPNNPGRL